MEAVSLMLLGETFDSERNITFPRHFAASKKTETHNSSEGFFPSYFQDAQNWGAKIWKNFPSKRSLKGKSKSRFSTNRMLARRRLRFEEWKRGEESNDSFRIPILELWKGGGRKGTSESD